MPIDETWREKCGLGKVRPERIKRIARELLSLYPDKFTKDFEYNKRVLEKIADIPSRKLRNRVAGYITSVISSRLAAEKAAESEVEVD